MIFTLDDINNTTPSKKGVNYAVYEEYFKSLYKNDRKERLLKLLGVLALPIIIRYLKLVNENEVVIDEVYNKITIPDDLLLPVAVSYIEAEEAELKEFGDAEVTESLNYVIDDNNSKITKYYEKINL